MAVQLGGEQALHQAVMAEGVPAAELAMCVLQGVELLVADGALGRGPFLAG